MIKIKVDTEAALRDLSRLDRHFRFAEAVALTQVAKLGQVELRKEAVQSFDRPTPFTLNSTYVKPATESNLVAEVGFKDRSLAQKDHYLSAEVHGGLRSLTGFEKLLRRKGVLGPTEYVVPARGFPLDAYGNVPKGVMTAILSDLQAHPDLFARSTRESRAKRSQRRKAAKRAVYFATIPGSNLPLGIYQRVNFGWGSSVRGVFMFVGFRSKQPTYRVRLPMQAILTATYNRHMPREMDEALRKALATANVGGSRFNRSLAWSRA